MRIAFALCALVVAVVATACSGRDETEPAAAPADVPRDAVLGIVYQNDQAVLRRFGRTSLTPGPGRVELGQNGGAWSFSPDETKVALAGGAPLEIRILDVRGLRLESVIPLPRDFAQPLEVPAVTALAWPTERRILALIEWGAWGHGLVVVDPVEGRVVLRETIDGALVGQARTQDGFALLLAPPGRIGPSRLLMVDSAGEQRSIALAEVPAGLETVDPEQGVQRFEVPAVAVDPTGERAVVVPGTGDVAAIDLVAGRVVYHALDEPISLLGRLRGWLEPTADAKASAGTERQATWVGDHLVAVSGQDHSLVNGQDDEQTVPAGLAVIDVRNWEMRTLDERASEFLFSAGTLLAYGIRGNSARQEISGMGLTAYDLDGKERFHLFGDESIYFVQAAGPFAYVWLDGASPVAVDLRSGSVVSRLDRYRGDDLPALVVP